MENSTNAGSGVSRAEVATSVVQDVTRFAQTLTRNANDTEDLVQDAYVRLFEVIDGLDERIEKPQTMFRFLCTLCRYIWIDTLRHRHNIAPRSRPRKRAPIRFIPLEAPDGHHIYEPVEWETPEDLVIAMDEAERIKETMVTLSDVDQEALHGAYWANSGHINQWSRERGLNPKTAQARVVRARLRFARRWIEQEDLNEFGEERDDYDFDTDLDT